ncbi:MAG: hypothetical protein K6F33_07190 [Bacteroidales bacterium]|nr:hypothetical protein [Bacteroidales bacterium]
MKELINNELVQLQKDLENLQSASNMIAQAGKASDAVINETKVIHEDFAKNLDKLTSLYTEFLEAANKQSDQNQQLVVEHVRSTITEQTSVLDKYNDLVQTANNNVKAMYDKAVESQAESIKRLVEESSQKFDEQSQLVKSNAAAAALNVETVKDAYLKQSAETDKLLNSYLELAQSTAELKDKIESVDFPSRLDTISKLMLEYTEQQKTANELSNKILETVKSDKVLRQAQSNEKTLSSIKTIATCILIFVLLGVAAVAFLIFKGMH